MTKTAKIVLEKQLKFLRGDKRNMLRNPLTRKDLKQLKQIELEIDFIKVALKK